MTAFDKEKPVAMQQQVLEGITQHRSFNSACYKVKGTSEETSRRSLEEDEVSYILVCAAEAWWYSRM